MDDAPLLTNGQLARIFHEIGDMLEVKGELVFKTVAYHRAADAIAHSPVEVAEAYRSGNPPRIPGVGAAISDKLAELASTHLIVEHLPGRYTLHDLLRAYAADLARFSAFHQGPVEGITADVIRSFEATFAQLRPDSRARKQAALASFLEWARRQGHVASDPMANFSTTLFNQDLLNTVVGIARH